MQLGFEAAAAISGRCRRARRKLLPMIGPPVPLRRCARHEGMLGVRTSFPNSQSSLERSTPVRAMTLIRLSHCFEAGWLVADGSAELRKRGRCHETRWSSELEQPPLTAAKVTASQHRSAAFSTWVLCPQNASC